MSSPNKSEKTEIRVKYDVSQAIYASQALVQAGAEEVFLDFSSSIVTDSNGARVMPIHTRVALSHAAARRLLTALGQTLTRHTENQEKAAGSR
ncbi:MAG: DUF3467 domain-containing protein [Verrucomicrobiales bacterium]